MNLPVLLALALAATGAPGSPEAALAAAGIADLPHGDELASLARAAGLDEAQIGRWLEPAAPSPRIESRLLEILGEMGTPASYPLLWRLSARGSWMAHDALDRIFERAMKSRPLACSPPTETDIEQMRGRATEIAGPRASAEEIADLAYLIAATRHSGPPVGEASEGRETHLPQRGDDPRRDRLYERLVAAEERGDLAYAAQAARDYLATLGPPGTLREDDETAWSWHGSSSSQVMRSLARLDEALGDFEEASALYRLANPFGGACGTGASHRWARQVAGLIRSEERLRGCAAVVPERLLAIDGVHRRDRVTLGPQRLAEAGFDVERLYRGAMVTAGRPGPDGWELRVLAIEGFADVAGRRAIPTLLALAESGAPDLAIRATEALGLLAERHCFPCLMLGGRGSSEWMREISPVESDCQAPFSDEERDSLSHRLLALGKQGDLHVRQAALGALGAIGSTAMIGPLRELAREPTVDPDLCRMLEGPKGLCTPVPVIREAAEEALQRLEEIPEQRRRCAEEAGDWDPPSPAQPSGRATTNTFPSGSAK